MFCSNCGTKLDDSMKFCTSCGTRLDEDAAAQMPYQQQADNRQTLSTGLEKNLWQYFCLAFMKYAVFNGRARRKEFWSWTLFAALFYTAATIIGNGMGLPDIGYSITGEPWGIHALYLVVALVLLLPGWSVFVRRYHDYDKRAWWVLVPIYGWIIPFFAGTTGQNRFGPDPKQENNCGARLGGEAGASENFVSRSEFSSTRTEISVGGTEKPDVGVESMEEIARRAQAAQGTNPPAPVQAQVPHASPMQNHVLRNILIVSAVVLMVGGLILYNTVIKPTQIQQQINFHWIRGGIAETNDRYDHAIADYTKAISLDPNNAVFLNSRAFCYFYLGRYNEALADVNKAIGIDPQDAYYYNTRGTIYRAQGQYDNAIADYTKAIQLDPKRSVYFENRAWAYFWKDSNQTRYDYDHSRAVSIDIEGVAEAICDIAINTMFSGSYDSAITRFDLALQYAPGNERIQRLKAMAVQKKQGN